MTPPGVRLHMWKNSIKPFVAACNLIEFLRWCHTGAELHCLVGANSVTGAKQPYNTVGLNMDSLEKHMIKTDTAEPAIKPFLFHAVFFLSFSKTGFLHCPQCNLATGWVIGAGGSLSDYKQLPLKAQKALCYFFHICSSTPQDLWTDISIQLVALPFK